jgi:hypothetical protein
MINKLIHIQIGNIIPKIVEQCFEHNKLICVNSGVEFIIQKEMFNSKKYICAGWQAEMIKAEILSNNQKYLICDWDCFLYDIPTLEPSPMPHAGVLLGRGNKKPYMDAFICACTTPESSQVIKKFYSTMFRAKSYMFELFTRISATPISQDYYHHFHTNAGLPGVPVVTESVAADIDSRFAGMALPTV